MEPKMLSSHAADFLGISLPALHKRLKSNDLDFKKKKNKIFFGHDTAKTIFNLEISPKIITTHLIKGGAGKTALTFNLAVRANLYGLKVLCIDLDQQGNLTQAFNHDSENTPILVNLINDKHIRISDAIINILPGLDLIPSHLENAILNNSIMLKGHRLDSLFKDLLEPIQNNYDLIFFDCPPSMGQEVTSAYLVSDLLLVPIFPIKFAIGGLRVALHEIANLEKTYKKKITSRLIFNQFDARKMLSHNILTNLIKHPVTGHLLFKNFIRTDQTIENMIADEKESKSLYDPTSPTAGAEDIDLLFREILNFFKEEEKEHSIYQLMSKHGFGKDDVKNIIGSSKEKSMVVIRLDKNAGPTIADTDRVCDNLETIVFNAAQPIVAQEPEGKIFCC